MTYEEFCSSVVPLLEQYEIKYSIFLNGDLGDLKRIEISGRKNIAGVEFWSQGWISFDIFSLEEDRGLMYEMLEFSKTGIVLCALNKFVEILIRNE